MPLWKLKPMVVGLLAATSMMLVLATVHGPTLGAKLRQLQFANKTPVVREYDAVRQIYVINVVRQAADNSCGRHTLKNLLYFLQAVAATNDTDLQNSLQLLMDQQKAAAFNEQACAFLGIPDPQVDLTFPHKLFNFCDQFTTFLTLPPTATLALTGGLAVINQICPIPYSFDPANLAVIQQFNQQLANESFWAILEADPARRIAARAFYQRYTVSNSASAICPWADWQQSFTAFKNSTQKFLGLMVLLPVANRWGHWVGIVISKNPDQSFEIFVLDAAHSTIQGKLKHSLNGLLAALK